MLHGRLRRSVPAQLLRPDVLAHPRSFDVAHHPRTDNGANTRAIAVADHAGSNEQPICSADNDRAIRDADQLRAHRGANGTDDGADHSSPYAGPVSGTKLFWCQQQ